MYKCFTEKGESELPTEKEINELINLNIRPLIFIDTNICLHIARFIDKKQHAKDIDRTKIFALKKYIDKHNIEFSPFLALWELSYKENKFDENKLWDFNDRIWFFIKFPYKLLKNYNFDFNLNFVPSDKSDLDNFQFEFGLEEFYQITYCSLLKIRDIALRNSLNKNNAEKNFFEFYDWMLEKLDIQVGIETRLALNIFGGATNFRKMIWLDGKNELAKKKIIGTVWDIIHARICSNNHLASMMLNENVQIYFLTNDNNLSTLMNEMQIAKLLDFGRGGGAGTSIIFADSNLPNYDEKFAAKLKDKAIKSTASRASKKLVINENNISNLIKELEILNNIS